MKELLGMELGYRESAESWAGVLRSLRDRGMSAPLLAVGDGALGLWAALDAVFPTAGHQRCWNHRTLNVQSRLPKALHAEARRRLRDMSVAPTRAECERLRDEYVADLRAEGRADAAETVLRDRELLRIPGGALGASADYGPVGVGVQRCKIEDGRHSADEEAGQRVVSCVQGGAEVE